MVKMSILIHFVTKTQSEKDFFLKTYPDSLMIYCLKTLLFPLTLLHSECNIGLKRNDLIYHPLLLESV